MGSEMCIRDRRPLVEGIQQRALLDVAQPNGEADFIENQLIDVAITQMATAGLPNRINSRRTTRVISLRETSRYIRAEPGESAAETYATLRSLMHPTFEELSNQHTTAQPSGAHRLAENTGEAAAIGRGMNLKLPLRLHQVQGWANRHQWAETSPLQSPVVLSHGVRGTMA